MIAGEPHSSWTSVGESPTGKKRTEKLGNNKLVYLHTTTSRAKGEKTHPIH